MKIMHVYIFINIYICIYIDAQDLFGGARGIMINIHVTLSPTEKMEIRNFYYPSVFKLAGHPKE